MSKTMKTVALVLAIVALLGCTVGGTLAWLGMKTDVVVNTFVAGDISITLTESDADLDGNANANTYKIIPGTTISKDPLVTVEAGSEACWLFVKIDREGHDILTYAVDSDWTELETGVYYIDQAAIATGDEDAEYPVLEGNVVSVADTVTKADMTAAKTSIPKLTFTAYAIQKEGFSNVAAAWAEAKDLS